MASVLIVGADRGIGYYLAEKLLERGNCVAALDVCTKGLEKLRERYPQTCLPIRADAADLSQIEQGVRQAVQRFGTPDAAVYNACFCTFDSEWNTDYPVYQRALDVNYFGALRLTKTLLPYMRIARRGRIIYTGSVVSVTGLMDISPCACSKGALESLARCMQLENEQYGVTFHLFHPPFTDTAAAAGIVLPRGAKADAKKVGYGLAEHMWSGKFVICHSALQAARIHFAYRHPLFVGRLFTRRTRKAMVQQR